MSDVNRQVAYLEGLAAGMRLDEDSDEGRLFRGLVEALRAIGEELEAMGSRQEYFEDYLSDLDDRICALEAAVLPEGDEEDEEELGLICPNCGFVFDPEEAGVAPLDDEASDLVCPECGQPLDAWDDDAGEATRPAPAGEGRATADAAAPPAGT